MKRNIDKDRKNVLDVLIIICAVIFLLCVLWLIRYLFDGLREKKAIDDLKVTYITSEPLEGVVGEPIYTIDNAPKRGVIIDGIEYPDFEDLEVPLRTSDFEGLQREENADIYAWIYIPDTNIDYPVLQHSEDPDYYMDHNSSGKESSAGSIFTQYYNNKDFNDNNTVIYGHNMKNGSMFKHLHKYEDETFFEEHPYVYLYTENDTRVYQIYAAYQYDDRHILLSADMDDKEVFGDYIDEIKKINSKYNHFNWDIGVDENSKIITLSTCIANKPESRYLVQAKLIAVEKNN